MKSKNKASQNLGLTQQSTLRLLWGPVLFVVAMTTLADADSAWQFRGTVVDGFDHPISNATIRAYTGHMGAERFEIDSEVIVQSATDGTFFGTVKGEHFATYRTVFKEPYESIEELGD